MAPPIDRDWATLDQIIALALDVIEQANAIKEHSDDPTVLYLALQSESAGLVIKKLAAEYKPRLRDLKGLEMEKARGAGLSRERNKRKG